MKKRREEKGVQNDRYDSAQKLRRGNFAPARDDDVEHQGIDQPNDEENQRGVCGKLDEWLHIAERRDSERSVAEWQIGCEKNNRQDRGKEQTIGRSPSHSTRPCRRA